MRISELIREDKEYREFSKCLNDAYKQTNPLPIVINGLSGGAVDAFLAEAIRDAKGISNTPVLLLVGDDEEASAMTELLSSHGLRAEEYKPRELVFHNISASHDIDRERLRVLHSASCGACDAVISTAAAAISYTMPHDVLDSLTLSVRVGDEISPETLVDKLVSMGFISVEGVESKGQFSRRGGIVDFWGAEMEFPLRVEFFGDEVDRLAEFDPISQRSNSGTDSILILPAREVIIDASARDRILHEIDKLIARDGLDDDVKIKLDYERHTISSELSAEFRDKYLSLVYENKSCLFDYFNDPIIFINGTNTCRGNAEKYVKKMAEAANGMLSYGAISERCARYTESIDFYNSFINSALSVHVNPFAGGVGSMKLSGLFGFRSRRTVSYGGSGNATMFIEDLLALRKGLYKTILLTENKQGAESLSSSLSDNDIASAVVELDGLDISKYPQGSVLITVGNEPGFDLITPRIAVLSMQQDKGRAIMAHRRRQRVLKHSGGAGKKIMSHADLTVGDYVVHANYGIGLFEGIEAVTIDGVTRDYITIRYAGTDKLFVPCDRLEMIGKYIGECDKNGQVRLSTMGGKDWTRTKTKAKAAVKDIAKNLIAIYAERQRTPGFAFPADSEIEAEFDADFSYEETESQLIAIEEIKRDMMRPIPMNRLLCGDVGFGKTEVALRAAFKAILGGKQVAILVPTTILALQHYQTALSRMRGYAVSVEMISRFKKPKERAEIIERTKKGSVDLLIGTHALLSKKIEFRDLGLLIIDEEQRFGVVQKEKLREMAKNVDTLMLSATPIPRTLNMSMSGINDISVLDEAPGERRPVQTYVLEHDDDVIIDALRRELARGGQTLYLYNKIEDIQLVAGRIADKIPEARVTYAHGKMEKEDIEDIWQSLVRGEIDILVCTTIIETGVDLPNANTLVIENAERFGLSQLHQIRGRVGRSERQAYAFFTYRRGKALSETAEKRLEAIKEFAEFGAGFKIALRDLEIRGAGNLLGAEQHGYIESVGYDLYIKLLNEAVLEEQGVEKKEKFESQIAINVSAHIPEYYIKSSASRMEMYKKITFIETASDKDELYDEFSDRFGEVPRPVMRLLNVAFAKAVCERAEIRKIEYSGYRLTFVADKPDLAIWSVLFSEFKNLGFAGLGSPIIVYRLSRDDDPTEIAARVMSAYEKAMREDE